MAENIYKGSVELISGLTQKNNGDFPLVNAPAIQVDDTGKRLDTKLTELERAITAGSVTLDKTLTKEGQASDAKAVGDRITALDGAVVKKVKINGVEQTVSGNEVNLPAYPTKESLGLGNVSNTPDDEKNVASAGKLTTGRTISLSGQATGSVLFDGTKNVDIAVEVKNDGHTHSNASITSLDASKLTGTIDIARLPQGALERIVKVENEAAMLKLTKEQVQLGDTVQLLDTGVMYIVVDEEQLADKAKGYTPYTAGSASSVPWSGITGKPETFQPATHTHNIADVEGLQTALDGKANASDLTAHTGNQAIHLTTEQAEKIVSSDEHAKSAHARADATKTAKSDTNGNIKINDLEVQVYRHATHTEKESGLYKVTVDTEGHVSATAPVTKDDITKLGIVDTDTGVTKVNVANGLTQNIEGRTLTLGISSLSTDLLANGVDTLVINGGRPNKE